MTSPTSLESLREKIRQHNHRYHVLDAPIISDGKYNRLLNKLKQVEAFDSNNL